MRTSEIEYWDAVGVAAITSRRENILKRCEIVRRVLERPPVQQRVLEIGAGKGYTAAAVQTACCGSMNYLGTELSPTFIKFAKEMSGLNVVQADILSLPDGPFDQVWAFDTLEHVRQEDRAAGYQQINNVLGERGIICLNLPLSESQHEGEFEHGITDESVMALSVAAGCRVIKWDYYAIEALKLAYAYVVLAR